MRLIKFSYVLCLSLLVGCTSAEDLYNLSFESPVPKSVKFSHSQEQYFSDCCNWLHFEMDSSELNKLLQNGFLRQEVDFSEWQSMVPPEAKDWWHPEQLGDSILYFEKETENTRDILFTTPSKHEVYHVHYYK
ncbi:hypothetical protein V9K67_26900 [Paraflavisolibacter sp. H34]|uniref:hypothetical protein n=1 Tax=Huijunlia imazamoxiresistens TaxID=3127457 RepID=UPI003015B058